MDADHSAQPIQVEKREKKQKKSSGKSKRAPPPSAPPPRMAPPSEAPPSLAYAKAESKNDAVILQSCQGDSPENEPTNSPTRVETRAEAKAEAKAELEGHAEAKADRARAKAQGQARGGAPDARRGPPLGNPQTGHPVPTGRQPSDPAAAGGAEAALPPQGVAPQGTPQGQRLQHRLGQQQLGQLRPVPGAPQGLEPLPANPLLREAALPTHSGAPWPGPDPTAHAGHPAAQSAHSAAGRPMNGYPTGHHQMRPQAARPQAGGWPAAQAPHPNAPHGGVWVPEPAAGAYGPNSYGPAGYYPGPNGYGPNAYGPAGYGGPAQPPQQLPQQLPPQLLAPSDRRFAHGSMETFVDSGPTVDASEQRRRAPPSGPGPDSFGLGETDAHEEVASQAGRRHDLEGKGERGGGKLSEFFGGGLAGRSGALASDSSTLSSSPRNANSSDEDQCNSSDDSLSEPRDVEERTREQRAGKENTPVATAATSKQAPLGSRPPMQQLAFKGPCSMLAAACPEAPGGYMRCLISRVRLTIKQKLYPTYNLYLQDGLSPGSAPKLAMTAHKEVGSRTPIYRFFDMTRGLPGKSKLSKKAGNYIGKLRGNFNKDDYALYGASSEKPMLAGIVYDKTDMVTQIREGATPRKMAVLLPCSDSATQNAGKGSRDMTPEERLASMVASTENTTTISTGRESDFKDKRKRFLQLQTKEPVFEKGNYRLNFRGRVKLPSVKNYQLVPPNDIKDVWTQFGKVTEDSFHLDFKAPLSPIVAFAISLSQFDY